MVAKLTTSERQSAAVILLLVALAGIAMAAAGRNEAMGVHGLIVILFAGALLYPVLSAFYAPEPTEDRQASYGGAARRLAGGANRSGRADRCRRAP